MKVRVLSDLHLAAYDHADEAGLDDDTPCDLMSSSGVVVNDQPSDRVHALTRAGEAWGE